MDAKYLILRLRLLIRLGLFGCENDIPVGEVESGMTLKGSIFHGETDRPE